MGYIVLSPNSFIVICDKMCNEFTQVSESLKAIMGSIEEYKKNDHADIK